MRRLFFLVSLLIMTFGFPTPNVKARTQKTSASLSLSCSIPQHIVDIVLKRAALKFGVTHQVLEQKYIDGFCTIEASSPKYYKVSYGGGAAIIILDDLL